jgi:hypothetical protein
MIEYSDYGKQKIKKAIEQYEQGLFKVWAVTADYRPKNEHKPVYYVIASSAKEAKAVIKSVMNYMKIYECVTINDDKAKEALSDPFYRIFNYERIKYLDK